MAPEILSIVRGLKGGTLTHEPDVSGELLFGTDAFACGCVIGFLCSRGKHPFSSTVFRNIPDVRTLCFYLNVVALCVEMLGASL